MTHTPEFEQPAQQNDLPQQNHAPQQTQPTVPLPEAAHQQAPAPEVAQQYAPHSSHGYQQAQQVPQAPQAASYPQAHQGQSYAQAPQHQSYPAFAQPVSQQPALQQPTQERKSRAGVWFAGIAIGALVGGVVGGGTTAIVMDNQPTRVVQTQQGTQLNLDNLDTATNVSAVAAVATQSVVTLEVSSNTAAGSGSGVIYSDDGYILTNAHVVTLDGEAGSNPSIRVWLTDGRILDGQLIGVDPFADIAVVKVNAENLRPIAIADSADVKVGDLAVAIGAPLNLSNTVTSGVVSALNRGISVGSPIIPDESDDETPESPDGGDFPWFRFGDPNDRQGGQQQSQATATTVTLPVIQTDASINPGNSGGALLNGNAELIGVNVAIASNASDSSTAGSVGLGFAIPSNMAVRVADALIAGERPSHGLLGVSIQDSSADTDEDRNVAGALIADVSAGGAAAEAGLRVGDVITAVNGIAADSGTTVSALVRMHEGGSKVTITYSRGGVLGETEVTLGTLEW